MSSMTKNFNQINQINLKTSKNEYLFEGGY